MTTSAAVRSYTMPRDVTFADREVWPDRPREQEVHNYWRIPPYWGP